LKQMVDDNSLSGKDRVLRTLAFQETDRVPVIPVTHSCSAKLVGYTLKEALTEPKKYVESQVKCLERFGYDGVWGIAVTEVAEALGCEIIVHDDDIPAVGKGSLADARDVAELIEPDYANSVWMNRKLEVIELLKKEVADRAVIIAPAITPLRAAAMCRGTMNFMLDLAEAPEFVTDLMEICTKHCLTAARIIGNTGADFLFLPMPLASKNLISRAHFERFIYPYMKRVIQTMQKEGVKSLVHPCGDWDDRLDLLADLKADMLQVTSKVDLKSSRSELGNNVTLMGKVDCLETMLGGTPDDVAAESAANITSAGKSGGFVLSSDCALPRDTPAANIQAMVEVAHSKGA
jgi:uroporphyrinogen decarboxylase